MTKERNIWMHRSEILFLYDVFRCNPNGDPHENRPRRDEITGKIDVTDVRLKRTIRDYIFNYKHQPEKKDGLNIYVRVGKGVKTAEGRYKEIFGDMPKAAEIEEAKKKLVEECVDVRLFGALVPITKKEEEEGAGIHITGAVQFNPGQSLHPCEILEIEGTGGFASREERGQKTFRREYIVPYGLIGFYGVINENLARESKLTVADVNLLMEALWEGTKSLHSRSKAFHHPRLLVRFDFKEQKQCGYFIDKLDCLPKEGIKKIRTPNDYLLKIDEWLNKVDKQKNYLEHIYCCMDSDLPIEGIKSPEKFKKLLNRLAGKPQKVEFIAE